MVREVLVAAIVVAVQCAAFAVVVREEVMPARENRDRWTFRSSKALAYGNGGVQFPLWGNRRSVDVYPDNKIPHAPRLPGARAFVVKTDVAPEGGRITLRLRREVGRKEASEPIEFSAPWSRETEFVTELPPSNHYYLVSLGFSAPVATNTVVTLRGIDAVTDESEDEALRIDIVSSGNDFRAVRYSLGETASLVFRNPTAATRNWKGVLTARDTFGRSVGIPYDVTLPPGGETRQELPRFPAKGLWKMSDRLRLAVIDANVVTPLQPKGEFRLGSVYHVDRYTAEDRRISTAAAVAAGMKLIRSDYWPYKGTNGWDFSQSDGFTDDLNRNGIAIDAIFRTGGREFGEAVARHFGHRISWYECGNEWDLKPKVPYADLVRDFKGFSEGVKSVCPGAKALFGGFAAESSTKVPNSKIRKDFQEDIMVELKGWYDAHATHLHSHYKEYVGKVTHLFKWRKDRGIDDTPWFANETAVTVTRVAETDVARMVWQKALYSWSRGSVDYVWYNLRGTGRDPNDSEQGYGLMTADYRPRATYAAFAALAKLFFRLERDGVLWDGKERQVMRWKGVRNGKPCRVIAGWDAFAPTNGCPVRVRTDATRVAAVDMMGNAQELAVRNGVAVWNVGVLPTALVCVGATMAKADAHDLAAEAKRPIRRIVPCEQGRIDPQGVLRLCEYDQVYEIYEAKPEYRHRTWRWFGDLTAEVRFFREGDEVVADIVAVDDVHCPDPKNPLEGDACVLRIGTETVTLVSDGKTRDYYDVNSTDRRHRTYYRHRFKMQEDGRPIPFNVRIYENDGEGPDGWIEYSPFDEDPVVEIVGR